ncbi:MAG TPA: biopolymer transporter ExbD [Planctomycetota bacterium]|nr:biopolymer transporter ExbD [Planctomycetota bacterium]
MAGSQDPNDNPVSIQVVPMVDIIFCLCVFFMCSMKWKELEGKFESWLPKDMGQVHLPSQPTPIEEIRVALLWDEANSSTIRKFGNTTVRDDTQLQELIRDSYAGWLRLGKPQTPAIVDAAPMVPWHDVVCVVNLAKRENIEKIQFAAGWDYEARK